MAGYSGKVVKIALKHKKSEGEEGSCNLAERVKYKWEHPKI